MCWEKKHYNAVNEYKSSVISAHNKHHGSIEQYFSFGNKARYKTIGGSSIGYYSIKPKLSIKRK